MAADTPIGSNPSSPAGKKAAKTSVVYGHSIPPRVEGTVRYHFTMHVGRCIWLDQQQQSVDPSLVPLLLFRWWGAPEPFHLNPRSTSSIPATTATNSLPPSDSLCFPVCCALPQLKTYFTDLGLWVGQVLLPKSRKQKKVFVEQKQQQHHVQWNGETHQLIGHIFIKQLSRLTSDQGRVFNETFPIYASPIDGQFFPSGRTMKMPTKNLRKIGQIELSARLTTIDPPPIVVPLSPSNKALDLSGKLEQKQDASSDDREPSILYNAPLPHAPVEPLERLSPSRDRSWTMRSSMRKDGEDAQREPATSSLLDDVYERAQRLSKAMTETLQRTSLHDDEGSFMRNDESPVRSPLRQRTLNKDVNDMEMESIGSLSEEDAELIQRLNPSVLASMMRHEIDRDAGLSAAMAEGVHDFDEIASFMSDFHLDSSGRQHEEFKSSPKMRSKSPPVEQQLPPSLILQLGKVEQLVCHLFELHLVNSSTEVGPSVVALLVPPLEGDQPSSTTDLETSGASLYRSRQPLLAPIEFDEEYLKLWLQDFVLLHFYGTNFDAVAGLSAKTLLLSSDTTAWEGELSVYRVHKDSSSISWAKGIMNSSNPKIGSARLRFQLNAFGDVPSKVRFEIGNGESVVEQKRSATASPVNNGPTCYLRLDVQGATDLRLAGIPTDADAQLLISTKFASLSSTPIESIPLDIRADRNFFPGLKFGFMSPVPMEFLTGKKHLPDILILEVWLSSIKLAGNPKELQSTKPGRHLIGLVKLPLELLRQSIGEHLQQKDEDMPLVLPLENYAVVDVITGTHSGWLGCALAMGTYTQINNSQKRYFNVEKPISKAPSTNESLGSLHQPEPLKEEERGSPLKVSSVFDIKPSLDGSESTSTESIQPQASVHQDSISVVLDEHRPRTDLVVETIPAKVADETRIQLSIYQVSGLNHLLELHGLPSCSDEVGFAIKFEMLNSDLFKLGDTVTAQTPFVFGSTAPPFEFASELTLDTFTSKMIIWIQRGGSACGQLLLKQVGKEELLDVGHFSVPLLPLLGHTFGVKRSWFPIYSTTDPQRLCGFVELSIHLIDGYESGLVSEKFPIPKEISDWNVLCEFVLAVRDPPFDCPNRQYQWRVVDFDRKNEFNELENYHQFPVDENQDVFVVPASPSVATLLLTGRLEIAISAGNNGHIGFAFLDLEPLGEHLLRWTRNAKNHKPSELDYSSEFSVQGTFDLVRPRSGELANEKVEIMVLLALENPTELLEGNEPNISKVYPRISSQEKTISKDLEKKGSQKIKRVIGSTAPLESSDYPIHIGVVKANHLPEMMGPREPIPPNVFVSFIWNGKQYTTSILSSSYSPEWNYEVNTNIHADEQEFIQSFQNNRLRFDVWYRPNQNADLKIGSAKVDLAPLLNGLRRVFGWYQIFDESGRECGELYITIQPLKTLPFITTEETTETRGMIKSPLPKDPKQFNKSLDQSTTVSSDADLQERFRKSLVGLEEVHVRLKERLLARSPTRQRNVSGHESDGQFFGPSKKDEGTDSTIFFGGPMESVQLSSSSPTSKSPSSVSPTANRQKRLSLDNRPSNVNHHGRRKYSAESPSPTKLRNTLSLLEETDHYLSDNNGLRPRVLASTLIEDEPGELEGKVRSDSTIPLLSAQSDDDIDEEKLTLNDLETDQGMLTPRIVEASLSPVQPQFIPSQPIVEPVPELTSETGKAARTLDADIFEPMRQTFGQVNELFNANRFNDRQDLICEEQSEQDNDIRSVQLTSYPVSEYGLKSNASKEREFDVKTVELNDIDSEVTNSRSTTDLLPTSAAENLPDGLQTPKLMINSFYTHQTGNVDYVSKTSPISPKSPIEHFEQNVLTEEGETITMILEDRPSLSSVPRSPSLTELTMKKLRESSGSRKPSKED